MVYELSNWSSSFGFAGEANDDDWKLVNTEEYTNTCCYCSGGCESVVSVRNGVMILVDTCIAVSGLTLWLRRIRAVRRSVSKLHERPRRR